MKRNPLFSEVIGSVIGRAVLARFDKATTQHGKRA